MKRLRTAVRDCGELPDGYAFKLDGQAMNLGEVGEWIGMERLCCPFLSFQIEASGQSSDWLLKMTGPAGVKRLLEGEFRCSEVRTSGR